MALKYKLIAVFVLNAILRTEYCSAQQGRLIEQRGGGNTISDRSFQNTVLSRQPISSIQTGNGRGTSRRTVGTSISDVRNLPALTTGRARIRMLRVSNPGTGQRAGIQPTRRPGTRSGIQSMNPGRTGGRGGQRTGMQSTRIVSRVQNRVSPRARQAGMRQSMGPMRTQTSRTVSVVRPSGTRTIRNRQRPGNLRLPNTVRLANSGQMAGRLANRQVPRTTGQLRRGTTLRRDPRTGMVVQSSLVRTRQSVPRVPNLRPLGRVPRCARNMAYVCRPFPPNMDRRQARRCVGACGQRPCVRVCLCACVTGRRSTSSQTQRRRPNNRRQGGQGGQDRASTRQNNGGTVTGRSANDLNFTLDNSVLTRLLANPDLNMLVGPEGINQILQGEPPPLFGPQLQERPAPRNRTVKNNTPSIDMGVPIPVGLTPTPPPMGDPFLDSMIAASVIGGESLGEISREIGTELLPSLTEFQRQGGVTPTGSAINNNNNAVMQPASPVSSLDAYFLGAILPMPNPISLSRDPALSHDRTNIVVNPSLLESGVIEPVSGLNPRRDRFTSLRMQAQALENALDANFPFESLSGVLSGGAGAGSDVLGGGSALNMIGTSGGNRARALPSERMMFENMMRSSRIQEPTDSAIMAAMMQTIGGAVDAVSAANSRNNSVIRAKSSGSQPNTPSTNTSGTSRPNDRRNGGNILQNFLTGTVKSTDQGMSIPTSAECFAQGRELWCDPLGIWESTPGITRWCLTNCRAVNSQICDQNRCECKCVNTETFRRNYETLSSRRI